MFHLLAPGKISRLIPSVTSLSSRLIRKLSQTMDALRYRFNRRKRRKQRTKAEYLRFALCLNRNSPLRFLCCLLLSLFAQARFKASRTAAINFAPSNGFMKNGTGPMAMAVARAARSSLAVITITFVSGETERTIRKVPIHHSVPRRCPQPRGI